LQKLLPNIKEFSDYFTFEQDTTTDHRVRETVDLLKRETPDFIPPSLCPLNSPDLNPVDYQICSGFTSGKLKTWTSCNYWERLDQWLIDRQRTAGAHFRLLSGDHSDMVVTRSRTARFCQHTFRSSTPTVWNDLPSELRDSDISREFVSNVA